MCACVLVHGCVCVCVCGWVGVSECVQHESVSVSVCV